MRKQSLFSLLVCLSLLPLGCGESTNSNQTAVNKVADEPEPVTVAAACNLKMGWDPWEPYQYLSPDGDVKGLEVELISAMARESACEITFVQDNWMNLLTGLRNGSIDMLGGATQTSSRDKFAYFSSAYRHETFMLYIRAGESDQYVDKDLQTLLQDGFRMGVTQDYIYGDQVNALQDNESLAENFVVVPITEVNYYNLTQDQIDGFLEDPFVAAFTIRRKGLQGQIEALDVVIHSGDVSVMFSRESVQAETVKAFNAALEKLKSSGEYEQILAKYSR